MAVGRQGGRELLAVGQNFGVYRVVCRLGRGGMGMVYLLENPADGSRVAAKLLYPEKAAANPEYLQRFVHEAEFALRIRHPNLIAVYDAGQDPDTGYYYILMEYVPGGNVSERLRRRGRFAVDEAVGIVEQIAAALVTAHACHVVHRDIKPDNIMFAADGTPKLADMGIAKFSLHDAGGGDLTLMLNTRAEDGVDAGLTMAGYMIGTPAYMAPEQVTDSHGVDIRADIYSLGLVFFEMLTGRRYNDGLHVDEIVDRARAGETIPDVRTLRPEVSAQVAQLLNAMCQPNRDARISTPEEVVSVFRRLKERSAASTSSLHLRKPSASRRFLVAVRTHPVVAAGVAASLLAGAVGFSQVVWRPRPAVVSLPKEASNPSRFELTPLPKQPQEPVTNQVVAVPKPVLTNEVALSPPVSVPVVSNALPEQVAAKPKQKPAVVSAWTPQAPKVVKLARHRLFFRDQRVPPLEFVACPAPDGGNVPLYISVQEVTVEQWVGATRAELSCSDLDFALGGTKAAIYGFDPRTSFLARLNERGTAGILAQKENDGWGELAAKAAVPCAFRLPTEDEWLFAARANVRDGDDIYMRAFDGRLDAKAYALIGKTGAEVKTALAQTDPSDLTDGSDALLKTIVPPLAGDDKWPNAWGLCDLAGNGMGELVLAGDGGLMAVNLSTNGFERLPMPSAGRLTKKNMPYTFRVVFGPCGVGR